MSALKPPTPGMLLVNTQLYREAKEILYSRNTFAFSNPQQMLDFLQQIGNGNKDRIQSISFWVTYFSIPSQNMTGCEPKEPHLWAQALISADLKNITRMHVQAVGILRPHGLDMDPGMENAIKNVLQGNPGNGAIRKLKLTGYNSDAYKKFPQTWEIIVEQWEEPDDEGLCANGDAVEEKQSNDEK